MNRIKQDSVLAFVGKYYMVDPETIFSTDGQKLHKYLAIYLLKNIIELSSYQISKVSHIGITNIKKFLVTNKHLEKEIKDAIQLFMATYKNNFTATSNIPTHLIEASFAVKGMLNNRISEEDIKSLLGLSNNDLILITSNLSYKLIPNYGPGPDTYKLYL